MLHKDYSNLNELFNINLNRQNNSYRKPIKETFNLQYMEIIRENTKCMLYKDIKTSYGAETYRQCNIISSLRTHITKFRLSSLKSFVERGRWLKPKLIYKESKKRKMLRRISNEAAVPLCCLQI